MHYFNGPCWDGSWHMGWMTIVWLVPLALIGVVIWAALRRGPGPSGPAEAPEAILKRRYAKGEIDRETYQRMLSDLGGG